MEKEEPPVAVAASTNGDAVPEEAPSNTSKQGVASPNRLPATSAKKAAPPRTKEEEPEGPLGNSVPGETRRRRRPRSRMTRLLLRLLPK